MKAKFGVILFLLLASIFGSTNTYDLKDKSLNETTNIVSGDNYCGDIFEDVLSEKDVAEEKISNNITVESTMPYYIRVNRTQNVVNVYSKLDDGTYEPYKAMLCSIGKATPKNGEIHKTTTLKCRWSVLKGGVYAQYITQIVDSILFHSVPYTKQDNSALEYWEYDKLGTDASLGCIRLTVENAKWIYDNIEKGTSVEFYEDENPGPLGKPEAVKISDNELKRGWDPTDEAINNPWKQE